MSLAPTDAAVRSSSRARTQLEVLISTCMALTALIEEENRLLMTERPHTLSALIARKEREASAFAQLSRQFQALPDAEKRDEPALLAQLRSALAVFDAALLRNGQLVMRLKQHQEGLLQAIAATQGRPNAPGTYGQSGRMSAPPGAGISALALNASI